MVLKQYEKEETILALIAKQNEKEQQRQMQERTKLSPGVKQVHSVTSQQKSSCEQPMGVIQIQRSRTGGKTSTEINQRSSG
jgi:hypothetical protein